MLPRRKSTPIILSLGSIDARASVGSLTLTVSGPDAPDDVPIDQQMRLVIDRVKNLEQTVGAHRSVQVSELSELQAQLSKEVEKLRRVDEDVRDLARDLGVGSLRLQVLGLVFVALGTVIGAVPALIDSF